MGMEFGFSIHPSGEARRVFLTRPENRKAKSESRELRTLCVRFSVL